TLRMLISRCQDQDSGFKVQSSEFTIHNSQFTISSKLPSVHKQQNSVHIVCVWRGQKRRRPGNVFGFTDTPERYEILILAHEFAILQQRRGEAGSNQTRADGVRVDAVRTELARQRL